MAITFAVIRSEVIGVINSLKTAFVWERRHSSVGSEQLICMPNKLRRFLLHWICVLLTGTPNKFGLDGVSWDCAVLHQNLARPSNGP